MQGVIARKVDDRGFGFVRDESTSIEYFFHMSNCVTPFTKLRKGQVVTFDEESSPKGPRATNITVCT